MAEFSASEASRDQYRQVPNLKNSLDYFTFIIQREA